MSEGPQLLNPVHDQNGLAKNIDIQIRKDKVKQEGKAESWSKANKELKAAETTDSSADVRSMNRLRLDIVSARVVPEQRKKYVRYTVMARILGENDDPHPATFERRYTEFLALYNALKRDYPYHFRSLQFPRKAILGNFSNETIACRSESFESFLGLVSSQSLLRHSDAVTMFLQDRELGDALKLIQEEQYEEAWPLVENCFRVMNKFQTDRAPAVLRNLCLLVCLRSRINDPRAFELASLAVKRYQGVSDADLLRYYVPLLNTAIELSNKFGKDTTALEEHLANLKRRGVALHASTPLLQLLMEDLSSLVPTSPPN